MNWWQYLLLVNIYLVLFYVFYVLLLRKETFFQLNRVYMVTAALLSFFIPAIQADWVQNLVITQQVKQTIYSLPVMEYQIKPTENNYIRLGEILVLMYLGGILVLSARLAWQLFKLKKVLEMPKADAPYSFFKKVRLDEASQDNAIIEAHEHVHAQQWHSADVLLIEMVMIINWFNPVVYFYRSAIKHIHEYIADRQAVLAGTDKADYALLLLQQTFNAPAHHLVNPFFNHSLLKKRIIMLQKNKSQRISLIKYGLSAPLFILMLILSSATINNSSAVNTINDKAEELFITPANEIDISTVVGNKTVKKDNLITATADTVDNDDVFSEVEHVPEFPGGIEAFTKFLSTNVRYPKTARDKGIEGRVICSFIVEKNGALSDVKIVKPVEASIDGEALRVLKLSPKWKPGIQNHHKVRVQYAVPINFTLEGDKKKKITIQESTPNKQVYASVERLPTFPGGIEAFGKFLGTNVRYPKNAREKGIQGRVICTFVVETDGTLSGITVLRGVDAELDAESMRVLKLSPHWSPGMQGKEKVRTQFSVPISFTLADEKKTGGTKQESKTPGIGYQSNSDTTVKKSATQITLRSADGASDPLYVLNGESITANQMKSIDVNSIESINVLKDKDATSIYGAKGLNGVVLITTKAKDKSKTLKVKPKN